MKTQEENLYTPNCIRTVSGLYMNVFEPMADMICIEDIAHALSLQCRFAGHLPEFYSVASHSINCSLLVLEPKLRLAALMHDASEAYLVDIPRPIKPHLTNYMQTEDVLMRVIADKYGFQYPFHPAIKECDEAMLISEWEGLMLRDADFGFEIKSPEETRDEFIALFKRYSNR